MRQYYALVAATVNGTALKYGSDDYYYNGDWYAAKLMDWPEPGDDGSHDYAILTTDRFDVVMDDADQGLMSYDAYWLATTWTVTLIMEENGQASTFVRQLTCTGWTRQPGQIQLQLEDLSSTLLEKLYPEHSYTADTRNVTFTISNDRVNLTSHGYANNAIVEFTTITSTTGISVNTPYYVVNKATDYFQVSLTQGGGAINLTTADGTGKLKTFPDILDTDIGRPVPVVVGYGIKVPCALLHNNGGAGPWVYGVCEKLSGWYYDVDYVYRGTGSGGPIVDAGEYTQTTYTGAGYDLVVLSFSAEQTDYSGQPYTIWADLKADTADPPTTKYNAATEASRLLTWAGLTPDTTSFATAATVASAANMWLDWCYGRDGNQTTLQALLDKLLLVLRGQICRADDGEWEIWQDTSGSSVASYDEDAGDLITVSHYQQPTIPATVKLAYQPDIADPGKLKHTLSRTISGGVGEALYEAEMIRDFTAADYLHSFLKVRAQYARTAEATVYGVQHHLGDIITLANDTLWSGDKDWIIRGIRRIPDGNQLDLLEYNASVYSYVAGTEPADGNTDAYGADYSETLPLAPSSFTVTGSPSSGVETGSDGIYTAYVNLICTPPAVNWKKIYFAASDGTVMIEGRPSGGNYIGTLRGLIPGKAYTLHAWAENAFGVSGLAGTVTTHYATLAHTAAADSTAPGVPTAPTATQGTGKSVDVKWTALSKVTYPDLAGYILKRATSAGGAYTEIWRGNATAKNDNSGLSYSGTYYYKVAAYDYSGNESADSFASSGITVNYISGGSTGEVRNIDAVNITAGTLTGRTVQTASGTTRVEMSALNNQLNVYDGGTNWASFGIKTVSGSDWVILDCGTTSFGKYAARFYNNNLTIATVTMANSGGGNALLVSSGNINVQNGALTVSGQISAGTMATTGSGDITAGGDIVASNAVYVEGTSGVEMSLDATNNKLYFYRRGGTYNGRWLRIDFNQFQQGIYTTTGGY